MEVDVDLLENNGKGLGSESIMVGEQDQNSLYVLVWNCQKYK